MFHYINGAKSIEVKGGIMLPEFIEERNVHAFEAGRGKYDAPAFLCTLCERPCSLSESYSNRGHHLVCNRCVNAVKKMLHIDTETFLMAFYDELMTQSEENKGEDTV